MRLLSVWVKIRQIRCVNFETSQFLFIFSIILQCHYPELLFKFLVHVFYSLDKRIPWKYQFWRFQVFWWKCAKFLMSFSKPEVSFSQIFHDSSVSRKITPLYFSRSNVIYFALKGPIKCNLLRLFECSDQHSSNSCHFESTNRFSFKFCIILQCHEI